MNQKSNVRLSWRSVHDEYQPVKSSDVLGDIRAVLYKWKYEIIGNSAYQTMHKHNKPSLEAELDVLREEVAQLNPTEKR